MTKITNLPLSEERNQIGFLIRLESLRTYKHNWHIRTSFQNITIVTNEAFGASFLVLTFYHKNFVSHFCKDPGHMPLRLLFVTVTFAQEYLGHYRKNVLGLAPVSFLSVSLFSMNPPKLTRTIDGVDPSDCVERSETLPLKADLVYVTG